MMKPNLLCAATLLLLAACGSEQQANLANFSKGMNTYLAKRGDLCLAKNSWPIDVTPAEGSGGSRNALQMPVLEKLGLVASSAATVEHSDEAGNPSTLQVRRYQLTDSGKRFYLAREAHAQAPNNPYAAAGHDLCALKLSLDKVIGWETPTAQNKGAAAVVVTYTYKVAPAPWTSDADVRRVFPVVDSLIRGAGVMQLKEPFVLTGTGWQAQDL
ncbi:MAG TPA: hypothetical protein DCW29_01460 [Janthinobacterium sp.]|nr:hypothetical protein [Janthinobacterium sp.]